MRQPAFDKYYYYLASVQSPDADIGFFASAYKELRGRTPYSLREDFCGTFAICTEWVKKNPKNTAYGLDLDPEPIAYGREKFFDNLKPEQQKRLTIKKCDVLKAKVPKVDLVVAMNFSYYLFKRREQLLAYFKSVHRGLKPGGLFIADCFGGPACQEQNTEKKRIKNFYYYWDQVSYNPLKNEALFYIHFQVKGQRMHRKVFTYDWRMWTMPELREIMIEAGFRKTEVYWEGTSRKTGEGNGLFRRTEKGEDCQAWVAYIAALK
jgi:SAM-dependent methyltransferase